MDKQKSMTFGILLEQARAFSKEQNSELENLYVYTTLEVCRNFDLCLSDWCCLEDSPTGDDSGDDVLPLFARENHLEVACSGQNIVDVISFALYQKPAVTAEELLESLEYYLNRDAFLELNNKNFPEINFVIIPDLTKERFTPIVERFGEKRLHEMPSISSVKVGDVVYPVTLTKVAFVVLAKLPVEKTEVAFDYLIRETGQIYSALVPDGFAIEHEYNAGGIFILQIVTNTRIKAIYQRV